MKMVKTALIALLLVLASLTIGRIANSSPLGHPPGPPPAPTVGEAVSFPSVVYLPIVEGP